MALFSVLEPPDRAPDHVTFVKQGFAPWAMVFTIFWALWHRMWVVAALLFALFAALAVAASTGILDAAIAGLAQSAVALLFGFEGRRLMILSRERAGYRDAGLIAASSLAAAELAYFNEKPRPAVPQVQGHFRPPPDDMLNLFGNL